MSSDSLQSQCLPHHAEKEKVTFTLSSALYDWLASPTQRT